ncbi:hypothetical protein M422DRAFT_28234 [Sphaerobolus stellatus SS14]|nr:hypothetical protein M422DRAFT_28234 [Sphaerobolus stellatus SS14]
MATLKGKSIVIFGGTSGIGFGVAHASLLSDAAEVLVVSSNPERVANAVKRLQNGNFGKGEIRGEVVDAKDQEKMKAFVVGLGEVDHIVYTSGDSDIVSKDHYRFPNFTVDTGKASFDVRFWGPVIVAQNAKFRAGGSLTLTGGMLLLKPMPGLTLSTGVMGAVDSVTRGLAVDLAPIRVNNICLGAVETELLYEVPEAARVMMLKNAVDKSLVKHVATPLEVAEAYLFAMKCTFLTGQSLLVDGGYVLGA